MNKPTAIEKEILEHIEYLLADTYGRNSFTKPLAKDLFQIAQKYAEMRLKELLYKRVTVTYREDNGHGWAVPVAKILESLKQK